jgi:hypothetical protein
LNQKESPSGRNMRLADSVIRLRVLWSPAASALTPGAVKCTEALLLAVPLHVACKIHHQPIATTKSCAHYAGRLHTTRAGSLNIDNIFFKRRCKRLTSKNPLNVRLWGREDDLRGPRPVCGGSGVNSPQGDRPVSQSLLRPTGSLPNP